jgi:hypothetical protein
LKDSYSFACDVSRADIKHIDSGKLYHRSARRDFGRELSGLNSRSRFNR